MIRFFLVVIVGILVLMVIKFVRLIMKFSASSRSSIDDMNKDKEKIRNHFKNVEEAEFRDLPPDDDENSSDKN